MNKLMIVGNLTKDPEARMTQSGISVSTFTVAVNRRHREGKQDQADYFRVTSWRQQGENCQKYLKKGNKVAVTGSVSLSTYQGQDGKFYASMDISADDVEFLSPKEKDGYTEVTGEKLPF